MRNFNVAAFARFAAHVGATKPPHRSPCPSGRRRGSQVNCAIDLKPFPPMGEKRNNTNRFAVFERQGFTSLLGPDAHRYAKDNKRFTKPGFNRHVDNSEPVFGELRHGRKQVMAITQRPIDDRVVARNLESQGGRKGQDFVEDSRHSAKGDDSIDDDKDAKCAHLFRSQRRNSAWRAA